MTDKKYSIMVIEDEDLLLKAITKKLELKNINCVACSSGKQALDYLSNFPELPDAIWLDYYLKDINGLSFMTEIKNNNKLTDIPVFVVSNSASQEKINSMLALGAKKYLVKAEYRLEDLINTIIEFIDNNQ